MEVKEQKGEFEVFKPISCKPPETLEEAREAILQYQEQERILIQGGTALTEENGKLKEREAKLQETNHAFFLRLQSNPEKTDEDKPQPKLEEIAESLKGAF